MQEIRYDGTDALTARATAADIQRALADDRNARVVLHRPGSTFERWEGGVRKRYRVEDDGSLQRLTLAGRDWPTDEAAVQQLAERVAALEARINPPDGLIAPPSRDEVERYRGGPQ